MTASTNIATYFQSSQHSTHKAASLAVPDLPLALLQHATSEHMSPKAGITGEVRESTSNDQNCLHNSLKNGLIGQLETETFLGVALLRLRLCYASDFALGFRI